MTSRSARSGSRIRLIVDIRGHAGYYTATLTEWQRRNGSLLCCGLAVEWFLFPSQFRLSWRAHIGVFILYARSQELTSKCVSNHSKVSLNADVMNTIT
jgi:hypothetical protein